MGEIDAMIRTNLISEFDIERMIGRCETPYHGGRSLPLLKHNRQVAAVRGLHKPYPVQG